MRTIIFQITIFLSAIILLSCGNKTESNSETQEQEAAVKEVAAPKNTGSALAGQANQLLEQYLRMKNGLVASNSADAKTGAEGMLTAIEALDTAAMSSEQKAAYNENIQAIKENAKSIAGNTDIAKQREHLNLLSDAVYALAKTLGTKQPLYYEFCPMANDNNGGYWLSEKEEIDNPYFGEEMPHCGEVKEVLK